MRRVNRLATVGMISFAALFAAAMQINPSKTTTWNFDSDKVGAVPADFKAESGDWKVVADDTAPSKPQVLAQVAKNDDLAFNVLMLQKFQGRNVDVQVKFRTVAGQLDQGCGIIWRAKDAKNYYLCRYNPIEANMRVYKVKDGARVIIHSIEDVVESKGWQTLRVLCRGKRVEGHLNGEARFSIVDENFMDAGMVGLWTKADAQTNFDDFQVEDMDH
jgi:hypothetical protein